MKRSVYGVQGGTAVAGVLVAMSVLTRPVAANEAGGLPDISAKVAALETQVVALQTAASELQSQLTTLQVENTTLRSQVSTLQASNQETVDKLACISDESDGDNVYFEGCNVHVRNGAGPTSVINGFGNLIIGYDGAGVGVLEICSDGLWEDKATCEKEGETWGQYLRMGSHNLVIGDGPSYTRAGGLVAGFMNVVNGDASSVTGGNFNIAGGLSSSVSGGGGNRAIAPYSSASGGVLNRASNIGSSVSGGERNSAGAQYSSVSGGYQNKAFGEHSSVSGGRDNTASPAAAYSSVSGGRSRSVSQSYNWRAGDLVQPE